MASVAAKQGTTTSCPSCHGEGGSYERIRVSYYDYGIEYQKCRTCEGKGSMSKAAVAKILKRQLKNLSR